MTREEAIKVASEMYGWLKTDREREALETLIPELAESEDERTIKLIRSLLENARAVQSNTSLYKQYDDALAWLEKQKEQKPINHNFTTFHRDVVYCAMCDKNLDEGLRCNLEIVYKIIKDIVDRTPVVKEQRSISFYGHYNPDDYEVVVDGNATSLKKKEQKSAEYIKRNSKEWYSLLAEQYDKGFWKGKAEQKPSGETNVEPDSKIPREEYLYHLLANDIITFTDYTYLMAKKPFDYECANIPQKDYTPVEQKPIKMEVYEVGKGTTICGQDYKCKKDYRSGVCWYIKDVIYHCCRDGYLTDQNGISWSCTPEWFNEYIYTNSELADKEKNDFVSGQFLQCKLSFDEFKEGEHYWLEYVGDDMYVGRSDNILKQKFHITPRQLYTLFSQQLEEKQKGQGLTAKINGEPIPTENYSVNIPLAEWSEEETKDLVHILKVLDDCYAYGKHDLSKTDHDNLTSTIKSLRPSWKPNEAQMRAIRNFSTGLFIGDGDYDALLSLIEDLGKLYYKRP